jgi:hypothetical protein
MTKVHTTITIDATEPSHKVDPLLYGVFFEETDYAGVGGLAYETSP